MKKGAPKHPKMLDLAARLGLPRVYAVGIMEQLWHWCYEYSPRGDIGKWDDAVISRACDWDGDPAEFVGALVGSGWVDRCKVNRLLVHDWHEHAPNWLHALVGRDQRDFALLSPSEPDSNSVVHSVASQYGTEQEGKGKEGKGILKRKRGSAEGEKGPAPVPRELASLKLYCVDDKLCRRWPELLPAWVEAYPGVDVVAEVKKAHGWEMSNPSRLKKDRPRFLSNWLNRAQDKAGSSGSGRRNVPRDPNSGQEYVKPPELEDYPDAYAMRKKLIKIANACDDRNAAKKAIIHAYCEEYQVSRGTMPGQSDTLVLELTNFPVDNDGRYT